MATSALRQTRVLRSCSGVYTRYKVSSMHSKTWHDTMAFRQERCGASDARWSASETVAHEVSRELTVTRCEGSSSCDGESENPSRSLRPEAHCEEELPIAWQS